MSNQRRVPVSHFVPLVVLATACSSASGPPKPFGTVLFTDPRSVSYNGIAVARTGFDTVLSVDPGGQFCLAFDRARLQGDGAVQLVSTDQFGNVMGSVVVDVASASWTWDGSAPQATRAALC